MESKELIRLCELIANSDFTGADKEKLIHALQYQVTVSALEARLRGESDYDGIMKAALEATRDFYDADDVLLANTDLNLQMAGTLMVELPRDGFKPICGNNPVYLEQYPMFLQAIERNKPLAIPDICHLFPEESPEHERLMQSNMHSFIAVPYKKRNTGLVAVINPRKHKTDIDLLQVLSYVVVAEINEKMLMEHFLGNDKTLNKTPVADFSARLIGSFEIRKGNVALTAQNFKGRALRFLSLLLLKKDREFSAEELIEALWDVETVPVNARKIVSSTFSEVQSVINMAFPDENIIESKNQHYRIVPGCQLQTDYQEVQDLYAAATAEKDPAEKAHLLLLALTKYPGKLLPNQSDVDGFKPLIAYYDYERTNKTNQCLELLYGIGEYQTILDFGADAFIWKYDDANLMRWTILAYIRLGQIRTAKQMLSDWRKNMPKDISGELTKAIKDAKL